MKQKKSIGVKEDKFTIIELRSSISTINNVTRQKFIKHRTQQNYQLRVFAKVYKTLWPTIADHSLFSSILKYYIKKK